MYSGKYINITINKLLDSHSGNSELTQLYMNKNKGEYPVYSAKTIGETTVGYIKTAAFDDEGLQLTTNGANAGTLIYREKHKFSLNGDARLYTIKDVYKNVLDIHYLHIELKRAFKTQEFDWRNKATKNKIANISISIPVMEDGTYDLAAQVDIANKYSIVETKKNALLDDKKKLLNTSIDIDLSKYHYVNKAVKEVIDLSQSSTNGSKFTLGFIQKHPGSIPVYGAAKFEEKVGYGYVMDNAVIVETLNGKTTKSKVKYFEDCLTYNIDGQGGCGYIFYRKGRFSLSEKVKPLIIFDKYRDCLDPEYLKYVMQPVFLANVRGRKITKAIIEELLIPIPIKEDGNFDLDAQKEIAGKYKQVENIKKALCKQIDSVLKIGLEM